VPNGVEISNLLTDERRDTGSLVEIFLPGRMIIMVWVKYLSHATQTSAQHAAACEEEMDKQALYGAP
jgi:hypothetical protein